MKALSNKELLDQLAAAVQALRAEYVPISAVEQYSAIIAEIARRLEQQQVQQNNGFADR